MHVRSSRRPSGKLPPAAPVFVCVARDERRTWAEAKGLRRVPPDPWTHWEMAPSPDHLMIFS